MEESLPLEGRASQALPGALKSAGSESTALLCLRFARAEARLRPQPRAREAPVARPASAPAGPHAAAEGRGGTGGG